MMVLMVRQMERKNERVVALFSASYCGRYVCDDGPSLVEGYVHM